MHNIMLFRQNSLGNGNRLSVLHPKRNIGAVWLLAMSANRTKHGSQFGLHGVYEDFLAKLPHFNKRLCGSHLHQE